MQGAGLIKALSLFIDFMQKLLAKSQNLHKTRKNLRYYLVFFIALSVNFPSNILGNLSWHCFDIMRFFILAKC